MDQERETAVLDCAGARARLADFFAGRLAAADFAAVQEHVENCAACRRALAALAEDPGTGQERRPRRSGLERRLAEQSQGYRRRRPSWFWMLALAAVAGYLILRGPGPVEETVAARLASAPVHDLRDFIDRAGAPDLATTEPEAAQAWLAARVPYALPAPPGEVNTAQLAGVRLAHFLDRDVPMFLYETDSRRLALYLFEAAKLPPVEGEDGTLLVRGPGAEGGIAGYSEALWRQGPLVYVLAGAMTEEDLLILAQEFAAAP